MKKLIVILLTIFIFPLNTFAYSRYVIPGGESLGISVSTNGIMIIGFYKIGGKYNKGSIPLKNGDYITKINNISVESVSDMLYIIESDDDKRTIDITFIRDGKMQSTTLSLIKEDGKYKTGLYVKDTIKGIGTLTFINPDTKVYGALGHEIAESDDNIIVDISKGSIFESNITGISKSTPGTAGSKIASFNEFKSFGNVNKNTKYGIYGNYNKPTDDILIEATDDIHLGSAYIKTVIDGNKVNNYLIEITNINKQSATKNITFKIIDDSLLNITGGVIQGMSGSPIIQDDRLVGALTHVVVDNPIMGYGLLIEKMINETE